MKITRRKTLAAWAWASCLVGFGCVVHESSNPAPRCDANTACPSGLICYRDFCLPKPDVPVELPSSQGTAHTDSRVDAAQTDPTLATVPPTLGGIGDTGGEAQLPDHSDNGVPVGPDQVSGPASEPVDAGVPIADAATPSAVPGSCDREVLRQRVDSYLAAMSTGDLASLNKDPSLRYTENGQVQQLGLGVWVGRPKAQFARHALDEAHCSAATLAVLRGATGRVILGLRLRYLDDKLLEVEAQVVGQNFQFFNPDGIIPAGADPWAEPLPAAMRMTRDALNQLVANYLDSSTTPALLPPHDPACRRRQDGVLMAQQGSCGVPAGTRPFEEKRYPLVDETTGIATAIVMYNRYLGMYLVKASGGVIQNIDIVGGAQSPRSGW